jgi:pilus assembly protein FimV
LAAAALLSLSAVDAQALALGRISVQSAIGEPLRADIELPEITSEEAASLRAVVASPEAFRAAGMEYSPALSNVVITLQRRPDGRYFLRLASDRVVNDPFIDLILETNWSSGRIVRDFTLLFDPPTMRQGQTPLTARVGPSTAPAAAGSATGTPVPAAPAARAPRTAPATPAAPPTATAPAPSAPRMPAPSGETGGGAQVTVQAGDTAGKIAAANKPNTVSLDQMLVAMLQTNPDAFAAGNINRLRAGAVLNLPTEAQAQAVTPSEASQMLVAQSRDFNEFRRRLAEGLPTAPAAGNERQASGRVQAQVEEKRPAAQAPDKLTLSKGAVAGGGEDKIARDRASQDSATRVAELNRNLSDLNKLTGAAPVGAASAPRAGASAPGSAAAPAARAASGPGIAVPGAPPVSPAVPVATTPAAPAVAAARPASGPAAAASAAPATSPTPAVTPAAPVAVAPASAPAAAVPASVASSAAAAGAPTGVAGSTATATDPASAASAPAPVVAAAPAAPAAPKRAPVPPLVVEEPSLVDDLLANPIVPAAAGGVLALLLGFGFWRARQRRRGGQVDSSFLESRLQPDSFFGASGGQRVDTAEGAPTGSSMVYSPSQLDAAGDVDPVAEADVYLAYGRDLQAEEILKEALRITPQRVAIHVKLLEIYAKRRDAKAFEEVASEAYSLTHGDGAEWARICELGQELDPGNSMYQPGGQPAPEARPALGAATAAAAAAPIGISTATHVAPQDLPAASGGVDLDLDLDFSLGDEDDARPATAAPSLAPAENLSTVALTPPSLDMDFGTPSASATLEPPSSTAPMELDVPSLDLPDTSKPSAEPPKAAAASAPAADPGMIEFDLGALSLDLGTPASPPAAAAPAPAAPAPAQDLAMDAGFELPAMDAGDADADGPLATKLALAEEFNAIGDADGARSLAQEVIAEASGDLKNRAQRFLAEIG